jgi:hypothetical protein
VFLFRIVKWMFGAVFLAAVLLAAVIGGYFYMDRAAKAAIERGGSQAMGVPTHLDSAGLSLRRSELSLQRLRVENPPGFTAPHFLELENGRIGLKVRTLLQDTIVLPELHLEGIIMHLEHRSGGSNYELILERIEELRETAGRYPTPERAYVIEEVVLRDITVFAGARRLAFLRPLRVTVDEIRLEDVGSESGEGLGMGQLQGLLVQAILQAIAREATGILSGTASSLLETGLAPASTVRGVRVEGLSLQQIINLPMEGLDYLRGDRDSGENP